MPDEPKTFTPGTFADALPQALRFDRAGDLADYLPALSADRLKKLRQRIHDLHAVIPDFETRRSANEEKAQSAARLKRLLGHRSTGGFELLSDDPRAVAESAKLAKLTAEAKRLNDLDVVRSVQWREAGYALANIEAWLRQGVPPGNRLEVYKTAVPALRKGETLREAIQVRERKISEMKAEIAKVEALPFPSAYTRKRMRDQISKLAQLGKPNIERLIKFDGDIDFVEESRVVPVRSKAEVNIASWHERNAFLLTVFANEKALVAALDADITANSDDANAMTHEQRQKATATIAADVLACDRELAELILKAQEAGLPHEFRATADPLAVLSLQLVVAHAKPVPAGTSPEHAYDLIQVGQR